MEALVTAVERSTKQLTINDTIVNKKYDFIS